MIRTASNCASLFSDEARRGEAEIVAAVPLPSVFRTKILV